MELVTFGLGFAVAALFVPPRVLGSFQRRVRGVVADIVKSNTNPNTNKNNAEKDGGSQ